MITKNLLEDNFRIQVSHSRFQNTFFHWCLDLIGRERDLVSINLKLSVTFKTFLYDSVGLEENVQHNALDNVLHYHI